MKSGCGIQKLNNDVAFVPKIFLIFNSKLKEYSIFPCLIWQSYRYYLCIFQPLQNSKRTCLLFRESCFYNIDMNNEHVFLFKTYFVIELGSMGLGCLKVGTKRVIEVGPLPGIFSENLFWQEISLRTSPARKVCIIINEIRL